MHFDISVTAEAAAEAFRQLQECHFEVVFMAEVVVAWGGVRVNTVTARG
jgi:hypothetical protein